MLGVKMTGNIHDYAKTVQMQSQWRQKQESGELTDKRDPVTGVPVEEQKSIVDLLTIEQPQERTLEDQNKLNEIKNKLQLGSSLSKEDLEYLKKNDPALYEEYMRTEEERKQAEKAYKEALKRCKTQQEVERLKTSALHQSLSRAKFVANNPHIPKEKKAALIGAEKRKTEDVTRNTEEFVKKGEYAKLPTEEEVIKAMKETADQQRAEMGIGNEAEPQETEKAENSGEHNADGSGGSVKEENPAPARSEQKARHTEAESDARRKARQAKAKAVYSYIHNDDKDKSDLNIQA